jgi:enoyl-[acyl-carrier protein] reductase II
MKKETSKPLVNVPMLYPNIEEIIIVEEVKITSAGNPKTWTPYLKENIGSTCGQQYLFALKAQNAVLTR